MELECVYSLTCEVLQAKASVNQVFLNEVALILYTVRIHEERHTYEEQEVEQEQEVLGGRDATLPHFVGSKQDKNRGNRVNKNVSIPCIT